jgi:peroxiredoxin
MEAYRDRYAKIQDKGAQIVAISTDDVATLKKFKESLGAPFTFLSDPDGKVADQYGGSQEGHAKRATFVVAQDGTIGHTDSGMASIVPDPAIDACPQGVKRTI